MQILTKSLLLLVIYLLLQKNSVPPDIDDRQTSSDVIVNENDDATLICKADGHPRPWISWLREDRKKFTVYESRSNGTAHSRRVNG